MIPTQMSFKRLAAWLLPFKRLAAWLLLPALLLPLGQSGPAGAAVAWSAKACYDKAQTQLDLNQCAATEYKQADEELNRLYKVLMPKLPKTRQQLLTNAQTAWLKFRDGNCRFVASEYEGGSMQPMIRLQCLSSLTLERNGHLRILIDDIDSK